MVVVRINETINKLDTNPCTYGIKGLQGYNLQQTVNCRFILEGQL